MSGPPIFSTVPNHGHDGHNQVCEHSDSGRRDDERVWGVGPADLEQGGLLEIESLSEELKTNISKQAETNI